MVITSGKGRYNSNANNIYGIASVHNGTAENKHLQQATEKSPYTIITVLYNHESQTCDLNESNGTLTVANHTTGRKMTTLIKKSSLKIKLSSLNTIPRAPRVKIMLQGTITA